MNSPDRLWVGIVSIFPDMFTALADFGVTGRAVKNGRLELHYFNPRDFTLDAYKRVDERPFGGGAGMVMMAQPLYQAITAAKLAADKAGLKNVPVIYMSPQGQTLTESAIPRLRQFEGFILLCGRYDGIDERLLQAAVDEEWSIGDYVLSGGELPAMVFIDTIMRRFSGVLGDDRSAEEDSFADGWLDYPQYTKPDNFLGLGVPEVLKSGHHQNIQKWRFKEKVKRTLARRPELVAKASLSATEKKWLAEFPDLADQIKYSDHVKK